MTHWSEPLFRGVTLSGRRVEWHPAGSRPSNPLWELIPTIHAVPDLRRACRHDHWSTGELARVFLRLVGHLPETGMTRAALETWLVSQVERKRLVAWGRVAYLEGDLSEQEKKDPLLRPQIYQQYARAWKVPLGAAVPIADIHAALLTKAKNAPQSIPPPVIATPATWNSAPTIEDGVSDRCPARNFRSENLKTAHPKVREWLDKRDKDKKRQEQTLGVRGGGGFLATTTRVARLTKGTILYRYYDDDYSREAFSTGGWWCTALVAGDPRQTLALPTSNRANMLAIAEVAFDTDALTGIGAPRCSNKPGGPIQWFIAYGDRQECDENDKDEMLRRGGIKTGILVKPGTRKPIDTLPMETDEDEEQQ